jgi:hypothetical protein
MTFATDWLQRFRRPAAVPSVPAVPAVPSEEPSPELVPVFAVLEGVEQEARRLREESEREVARRQEAATAEVESALSRWRRRADAERVRAEVDEREKTAHDVRAIELAAAAEADRLRARGLERIPGLVDEIVSCVGEESR